MAWGAIQNRSHSHGRHSIPVQVGRFGTSCRLIRKHSFTPPLEQLQLPTLLSLAHKDVLGCRGSWSSLKVHDQRQKQCPTLPTMLIALLNFQQIQLNNFQHTLTKPAKGHSHSIIEATPCSIPRKPILELAAHSSVVWRSQMLSDCWHWLAFLPPVLKLVASEPPTCNTEVALLPDHTKDTPPPTRLGTLQ